MSGRGHRGLQPLIKGSTSRPRLGLFSALEAPPLSHIAYRHRSSGYRRLGGRLRGFRGVVSLSDSSSAHDASLQQVESWAVLQVRRIDVALQES